MGNKKYTCQSSIVDWCGLNLNQNQTALNFIKEKTPELLTTKRMYLLDNPDILNSSKNYFAMTEEDIVKKISKDRFQYLILCRFIDDNGKILKVNEGQANYFRDTKKTKIYDSLFGHPQFYNVLVGLLVNYSDWTKSGIFNLFNVPYYGSNVEIYTLNKNK